MTLAAFAACALAVLTSSSEPVSALGLRSNVLAQIRAADSDLSKIATDVADKFDLPRPIKDSITLVEAYVYGFPLMEMLKSMEVQFGKGLKPNYLASDAERLDCTFVDVVTPNVDTAYSQAWMDLSSEPMVLSVAGAVPAPTYYSWQILDMYTNTVYGSLDPPSSAGATPANSSWSVLGLRNLGRTAWSTLVYSGDAEVDKTDWYGFDAYAQSQTSSVWLLGRTGVTADTNAGWEQVGEIQANYTLVPLSVFRACGCSSGAADCTECLATSYTPPSPPAAFYDDSDGVAWYQTLNQALAAYPPPADQDAAALAEFASVGVGPGLVASDSSASIFMDTGVSIGDAYLELQTLGNGVLAQAKSEAMWTLLPSGQGTFGTDYLVRAAVAKFGLGANPEEEAVYPVAKQDSWGLLLDGANTYTLNFPGFPQVDPDGGFWSITLYDSDSRLLVCNEIGVHHIGTYSANIDELVTNDDGSFTLYVGPKAPRDASLAANWLPTWSEQDKFYLVLRQYLPVTNTDGTPVFVPQPVRRSWLA